MRKLTLAVIMLCNIAYGQTIYDQFNKAINNNDTVQMTTLIRQIQASNDESAERYIAEFNYYFNVSKQEVIATSQELPKNVDVSTSFTLTDSAGQPAGYLYGYTTYDKNLSDSALAVIDKGIAAHPNRLDMRFGKIFALGDYSRWDAYVDEIMNVLNYICS